MVETICIMVAGEGRFPRGTSYNDILRQKKESFRKGPEKLDKVRGVVGVL
ncbi:MAG: hypothetical protein NHB15_14910 [Methanosarcina barkeri]|nr:hypothetical protein [Methanosarcina sp. ERenArc_MAG2]